MVGEGIASRVCEMKSRVVYGWASACLVFHKTYFGSMWAHVDDV